MKVEAAEERSGVTVREGHVAEADVAEQRVGVAGVLTDGVRDGREHG